MTQMSSRRQGLSATHSALESQSTVSLEGHKPVHALVAGGPGTWKSTIAEGIVQTANRMLAHHSPTSLQQPRQIASKADFDELYLSPQHLKLLDALGYTEDERRAYKDSAWKRWHLDLQAAMYQEDQILRSGAAIFRQGDIRSDFGHRISPLFDVVCLFMLTDPQTAKESVTNGANRIEGSHPIPPQKWLSEWEKFDKELKRQAKGEIALPIKRLLVPQAYQEMWSHHPQSRDNFEKVEEDQKRLKHDYAQGEQIWIGVPLTHPSKFPYERFVQMVLIDGNRNPFAIQEMIIQHGEQERLRELHTPRLGLTSLRNLFTLQERVQSVQTQRRKVRRPEINIPGLPQETEGKQEILKIHPKQEMLSYKVAGMRNR